MGQEALGAGVAGSLAKDIAPVHLPLFPGLIARTLQLADMPGDPSRYCFAR